jgi:hypothetical protein
MTTSGPAAGAGILAVIAFIVTLGAAWITHCVWWIKLMMSADMEVWQGVLAVLGTVALPIGVIHGFIIWFS